MKLHAWWVLAPVSIALDRTDFFSSHYCSSPLSNAHFPNHFSPLFHAQRPPSVCEPLVSGYQLPVVSICTTELATSTRACTLLGCTVLYCALEYACLALRRTGTLHCSCPGLRETAGIDDGQLTASRDTHISIRTTNNSSVHGHRRDGVSDKVDVDRVPHDRDTAQRATSKQRRRLLVPVPRARLTLRISTWTAAISCTRSLPGPSTSTHTLPPLPPPAGIPGVKPRARNPGPPPASSCTGTATLLPSPSLPLSLSPWWAA